MIDDVEISTYFNEYGRMIPICPICGHHMYYVGEVYKTPSRYRRHACAHCDHVEDWLIMGEIDRMEFLG